MIYYILAVLLTAIDQITKYIAVEKLNGGSSVEFIKGVINFTYVENRGVAFGMFQGMHYLFVPLGLIAAALCVWYMHISLKKKQRFKVIAVAMIVSGAIGNIIDKIFRGFVVDFIDAVFIDFPVFNFADICITVGAVVAAICIMLEKDTEGVKSEE